MKQQNVQSIQEKMESKPPVKTNWKLIVIVGLAAVAISVVGILLFQNFPSPIETVYYSNTCAWRPDKDDYGPCSVV